MAFRAGRGTMSTPDRHRLSPTIDVTASHYWTKIHSCLSSLRLQLRTTSKVSMRLGKPNVRNIKATLRYPGVAVPSSSLVQSPSSKITIMKLILYLTCASSFLCTLSSAQPNYWDFKGYGNHQCAGTPANPTGAGPTTCKIFATFNVQTYEFTGGGHYSVCLYQDDGCTDLIAQSGDVGCTGVLPAAAMMVINAGQQCYHNPNPQAGSGQVCLAPPLVRRTCSANLPQDLEL